MRCAALPVTTHAYIHTELGLDDVILTECMGPTTAPSTAPTMSPTSVLKCKSAAQVKPLKVERNKSFTYTVKMGCPKTLLSKTGQTMPVASQAVLTVQLPPGFSLAGGYAPNAKFVKTVPSANTNGTLTWTVPNPSSNLALQLQIRATTCVAQPYITGQMCLDSACQTLRLSKPVRAPSAMRCFFVMPSSRRSPAHTFHD